MYRGVSLGDYFARLRLRAVLAVLPAFEASKELRPLILHTMNITYYKYYILKRKERQIKRKRRNKIKKRKTINITYY